MLSFHIPLAIVLQSILISLFSSSSTPLACLLSIQLRLAAYTFLRWIPAQHGPYAVPLLFVLSCLPWWRYQRRLSLVNLEALDESNPANQDLDLVDSAQSSLELKPDLGNQSAQLSTATDRPIADLTSPSVTSQQSGTNEPSLISESTPLLFKPPPPAPVTRPPTTLVTLLKFSLGLPTHSRSLNWLAFLTNFTLTVFCLDASFRTLFFHGQEDLAFTRVGAVGETWAKVQARVPGETGIEIVYRPMERVGAWLSGPSLAVRNESDWTAVGKIDGLWPGTAYEYRLVEQGSKTPHVLFPRVGHFKTAPDSRLLSLPRADGGSFTFAYTSCIKPGFPYSPLRDPLHNDGAEHLAELASEQPLDFVLFLGDFIYADSPFYPGNAVEHYWRKYRQSYGTAGWKRLMQVTRTLHIYDDHEIYNDFAGRANDSDPTFVNANRAYTDYLGSANFDGPGRGENYYWFRHADAAFFVWDTRRYRSTNGAADGEEKTMLGQEQKDVFQSWLAAVNSTVTFKFVVSSTPFMSLWLGPDGAEDTWAGFLTERNELMDVMEFVPNLIVLSGDRHEFAAASLRDSVIEFSTSPLNQFWLPIQTLSQENGLGKSGEEKLLKYLPRGNHKFSTLKVDCRKYKEPKVEFKLYVDEKVAWELTYIGKPARTAPKELGELVPSWEQLLKILKEPFQWFSNRKGENLTSSFLSEDAEGGESLAQDASEE